MPKLCEHHAKIMTQRMGEQPEYPIVTLHMIPCAVPYCWREGEGITVPRSVYNAYMDMLKEWEAERTQDAPGQ